MADTGISNSDGANGDTKEVLTIDDWKKMWEERRLGFHESDIHDLLVKHKECFLNGRQSAHIFFPLCGKAVDMKWLADMGHRVVGLDGCEMAINEFFQEQELKYTVSEVPEFGQVYKSEDGNISIYCGDLFQFNKDIEGEFDCIWDRSSFVAMHPVQRPKYCELLTSLMAQDCRYLLVTYVFDQSKEPGPPFSASLEDLKTLYDANCDIEEIDSRDALNEDRKTRWSITSLIENVNLITSKKETL